jgi:flagellar basal body-associated protein FliL
MSPTLDFHPKRRMAKDAGKNQGNDDIIPLDKLVGDAAVSPSTPPPLEDKTAVQPPAENEVVSSTANNEIAAAPNATPPSASLDIASVDAILNIETPGFTDGLKDLEELKAEDAAGVPDPDLEKLVAQEIKASSAKGFKFLLLRVKRLLNLLLAYAVIISSRTARGAVASFYGSKDFSIQVLKSTKQFMTWLLGMAKKFLALPRKTKIQSFIILALAGTLGFVLKLTYRGAVLPRIEIPLLRSFADVADEKYTIDEKEAWEDFNDPLFHPEHVVAIDRVVANLLPPGDGRNPMVLMDLFVEAANKEGAIEIKVREAETRDVISRTVEQMPYEELITLAGKTKLKVLLRQRLNGFLTQGRVRRVMFRTIVLKP